MFPVLFRAAIGDSSLAIGTYSVSLLLAALVAVGGGVWRAAAKQLPRRRVILCLGLAAAAALPGARIWYVLTHLAVYIQNPSMTFVMRPVGLSLAGGIFLSAGTGVLSCRLLRLPVWTMADSTAPGLLLATAIMRLGCFGRGCCFGRPTDLPWGIQFPTGSPAYQKQLVDAPWSIFSGPINVHPSQIYEIVGLSFATLLVLRIGRSSSPGGTQIILATALLALIHGGSLATRDFFPSELFASSVTATVDFIVALVSLVLLMLSTHLSQTQRLDRYSLPRD